MVIIEMNPRVSRSSALASKATGFPIAKIAAKLAVGYRLDEITQRHHAQDAGLLRADHRLRRRQDPASGQFEKFPGAEPMLGTQMKSVGEVMAIGRTFKQALWQGHPQPGNRQGLRQRSARRDADPEAADHAQSGPARATSASPSSSGYTVEQVHEMTAIDPWFLKQMQRDGGARSEA